MQYQQMAAALAATELANALQKQAALMQAINTIENAEARVEDQLMAKELQDVPSAEAL
jgi:mannose/cellobiose epimerase-like protein (N-acyl-D-glucosamine 2-epimerase family)